MVRASDRMCSKGAVSQIPLVPLRIPILPGVGCGRRDHHPKVWVPVGSLKGFVMEGSLVINRREKKKKKKRKKTMTKRLL